MSYKERFGARAIRESIEDPCLKGQALAITNLISRQAQRCSALTTAQVLEM